MANIIKFGGGGQKFKKILRQIATQARNVLSGTYFVNSEGEVTEGSIPVHDDYQISDTVTSTRIGADTYVSLDSLPEGYYHASSVETESWAPAARANVTNFGNAAVENVLTGKTFTSSAGLRAAGTMPDMTGVDPTLGGINTNYPSVAVRKGSNLQIGTTVTSHESLISLQVPKGYWDGEGYVGSPATNFGEATRAQVLNGKTFTSTAGIKLTGSMTNNGSLGTRTLALGGSYTIPAGYTSGGTVKAPTLGASGGSIGSMRIDTWFADGVFYNTNIFGTPVFYVGTNGQMNTTTYATDKYIYMYTVNYDNGVNYLYTSKTIPHTYQFVLIKVNRTRNYGNEAWYYKPRMINSTTDHGYTDSVGIDGRIKAVTGGYVWHVYPLSAYNSSTYSGNDFYFNILDLGTSYTKEIHFVTTG